MLMLDGIGLHMNNLESDSSSDDEYHNSSQSFIKIRKSLRDKSNPLDLPEPEYVIQFNI